MQRQKICGTLRGLLSSARKKFAKPNFSQNYRARWWRVQLRGLLGYFAAFIGPGKEMYRELEVIGNMGARFVAGLPQRFLLGPVLERIQGEHKIHVLNIFSEFVVKRMGHCFRHPDTPLHSFLSRPLGERLTSLRLTGRRAEVSSVRWDAWQCLANLGLNSDPPVGGFPLVRGHSGFVCRWGAGWFEELREGLGWNIERHDELAVSSRVSMLLGIFRRSRASTTFSALLDAPMALDNG